MPLHTIVKLLRNVALIINLYAYTFVCRYQCFQISLEKQMVREMKAPPNNNS